MKTQTNTIEAGQTITARSICDYHCIFSAKVISRKGNFVTLFMDGVELIKKVNTNYNGEEYVMALGSYSMAPAFTFKG